MLNLLSIYKCNVVHISYQSIISIYTLYKYIEVSQVTSLKRSSLIFLDFSIFNKKIEKEGGREKRGEWVRTEGEHGRGRGVTKGRERFYRNWELSFTIR